jgi:regulator of sirC expression with transglutaminase-like and TPR domain
MPPQRRRVGRWQPILAEKLYEPDASPLAARSSKAPMLGPNQHDQALKGFAELVNPARTDEAIDLAAAALALARIEYPELDLPAYVRRLNTLANRVKTNLRANPGARETVAALNRVLFEEEGLRGNRDDYYDPRNSFLNDVLDRKLGIPITLSVAYMEVARRIGFPMAGTGMPGHFLLKHYDALSGDIIIDAFNRGCLLTLRDCRQRLHEIYHGEVEFQPEFLHPVTHREILTRMLNNLRQIYFTQRNFRKGLMVLDLLIAIPPLSTGTLRERALVRLNLDQYVGAAQDLANYLKLCPEAPDADDVRETLEMVRQLLARLN